MADPKKKKTILMSTQPSEEDWQPSLGDQVVQTLKDKASLQGFSVKVAPTTTDSFNVGAIKSKDPAFANKKDTKNKYFFGLQYTKQF